MMASSKKRGVKLSLRVAKRAVRTLAKAKARPHFGNAGAIDNLLSKGIVRMQAREHSNDELVIDDFDYDGDSPDGSTLESLFDDMIGCVSVKEKMSELNSTVVFSRAQGKEAAASGVGYNVSLSTAYIFYSMIARITSQPCRINISTYSWAILERERPQLQEKWVGCFVHWVSCPGMIWLKQKLVI